MTSVMLEGEQKCGLSCFLMTQDDVNVPACLWVDLFSFILTGMHNFFIYLSVKVPSGCSCFPCFSWLKSVQGRIGGV